jgi:hypothetical protein
LQRVSIVITLAGALLVAGAVAFDLGQGVALAGMLAAVAGVVKLAMVGLWNGVAGFGAAASAGDETASGEVQ